jgi:hypothetical protein
MNATYVSFVYKFIAPVILRFLGIGVLFLTAHALFCQSTTPGDVNQDNSINIVDALLVAQYAADLPNVFIDLNHADVDVSSTVDIVDALLIAQYTAGIITHFPGEMVSPTPTMGGYSFTGILPNGLINSVPVTYTTTANYDGTNVKLTFNGGPGFEWVWLYAPTYYNMLNIGNNIWSLSLDGYAKGSTLEYYFTVRKNGQEANNSSTRHVWVVGRMVSPTPTSTVTPTPTPTPTPTIIPTSTPTGSANPFTLVWSDEFTNNISPDWVFETGNGSGGWGNNELEYYRRENAYVANGTLVIEARRENYGGFAYTSARMKTQGRRSWQYGRIEARIRLTPGQGIWPAFWMLGDSISSVNWPACGEIDIMEHINNESTVYGTIHWDTNGYAYYTGSTGVNSANYHVYAIEWNTKSIRWYVDGIPYHEANIENNTNRTEEFHRSFFLLLNVAVGGNWPGAPSSETTFPAYMYVDYVRVYQ